MEPIGVRKRPRDSGGTAWRMTDEEDGADEGTTGEAVAARVSDERKRGVSAAGRTAAGFPFSETGRDSSCPTAIREQKRPPAHTECLMEQIGVQKQQNRTRNDGRSRSVHGSGRDSSCPTAIREQKRPPARTERLEGEIGEQKRPPAHTERPTEPIGAQKGPNHTRNATTSDSVRRKGRITHGIPDGTDRCTEFKGWRTRKMKK